MEEDESCPRVRVAIRGRSPRPLRHVHVTGEGDVLQHDQKVSDGQPRKQGVGRRRHLPTRQHGDVETVGHRAEETDDETDVAVNLQQNGEFFCLQWGRRTVGAIERVHRFSRNITYQQQTKFRQD